VSYLLDTHILLWWFEAGNHLTRKERRALSQAGPDTPLLVSDISLWEIATLTELGRIRLTLPLRSWLEEATALPLVRRCGISPAVAAEVAALPPTFHGDPADRIIVATARLLGATLITHDERILRARVVPTLGR